MLCFCKTLHVLSVALWFGSVAFFTVAGLLIFQAFSDLSRKPESDRPWFPVPEMFRRDPPAKDFPDPLRLEQGSRAAGVAVSRIFPVYYGLQVGCGIVALVTALAIARAGQGSGQRWRIVLCVLALTTVGLGWWLETVVGELRIPRNELTDKVLTISAPTQQQLEEAQAARAEFGRWHGYSLMQNFATLALVMVVTALAGQCPSPPGPLSQGGSGGERGVGL
jgi:hypothetical protein